MVLLVKKKALIFIFLISQKKNNSNTLKTFLEEKIDKEGYKGKRMRRYQRFDCVRWWSLWIKRHEAVMRLRHRSDVFLTHYNWYSSSQHLDLKLDAFTLLMVGRDRKKDPVDRSYIILFSEPLDQFSWKLFLNVWYSD